MTLNELIERLQQIKENHEQYGRLKVVKTSKKHNNKELVSIEVKVRNLSHTDTDFIILNFE